MAGSALQVYARVADPLAFADQFAESAAAIMICNKEQGRAIALSALCDGLTIMEYRRRYHWIPGKGESMKAHAMLAEFRMNYGGKFKINKTTTKECSISFVDRDGVDYPMTFTRIDMLLARWPWGKKEGQNPGWQVCVDKCRELQMSGKTEDEIWLLMHKFFKDNWGTELDWKNMLFARLVSDSLKMICPELFAGVYTPEELEDIDTIAGEILPPKAPAPTASDMLKADQGKKAEPEKVATTATVTTATTEEPPFDPGSNAPAEEEGAIDAEFTFTSDEPAAAEPTWKQKRLVEKIMDGLPIAFGDKAEQQLAATLAKRKVAALSLLDEKSLQEIADKVESLIASKKN